MTERRIFMSFSDLFTSDILTRVTSVKLPDMVLCVVLSFLLGLFIYYVYQRTFRGVMLSTSFGLTLIGLCMISSMLILAVSSNIVLSLGMVGALSIVRFRTAIKEPLDIVFLFWAISAGIILAVGLIPLAVLGSIAIGLMLILFAGRTVRSTPYILVVSCTSSDSEPAIMTAVTTSTARCQLKDKTFSAAGNEELTLEVLLKDSESAFVKTISTLPGVTNVAMVSYNGDYMS